MVPEVSPHIEVAFFSFSWAGFYPLFRAEPDGIVDFWPLFSPSSELAFTPSFALSPMVWSIFGRFFLLLMS